MNRRKFLVGSGYAAGYIGAGSMASGLLRAEPRTETGSKINLEEKPVAFTVPPLPYSFDALEPYIDAKTMEIHHDKHHGAYVANLNKALEGHPELQSKSIDDLMKNLDAVPENIRTAVRNNGGGHWNHSLFWLEMKKGGGESRRESWARRSSRPSDRSKGSRISSKRPDWDGSDRAGRGCC